MEMRGKSASDSQDTSNNNDADEGYSPMVSNSSSYLFSPIVNMNHSTSDNYPTPSSSVSLTAKQVIATSNHSISDAMQHGNQHHTRGSAYAHEERKQTRDAFVHEQEHHITSTTLQSNNDEEEEEEEENEIDESSDSLEGSQGTGSFIKKKKRQYPPWTPDEDKVLIAKQQEIGNNWVKVATFLPGRSRLEVKSRHRSIMRALKKVWKPGEDKILLELHATFKHDWVERACKVLHRSRNAVRVRFKTLTEPQVQSKTSPSASSINSMNLQLSASTMPSASASSNQYAPSLSQSQFDGYDNQSLGGFSMIQTPPSQNEYFQMQSNVYQSENDSKGHFVLPSFHEQSQIIPFQNPHISIPAPRGNSVQNFMLFPLSTMQSMHPTQWNPINNVNNTNLTQQLPPSTNNNQYTTPAVFPSFLMGSAPRPVNMNQQSQTQAQNIGNQSHQVNSNIMETTSAVQDQSNRLFNDQSLPLDDEEYKNLLNHLE